MKSKHKKQYEEGAKMYLSGNYNSISAVARKLVEIYPNDIKISAESFRKKLSHYFNSNNITSTNTQTHLSEYLRKNGIDENSVSSVYHKQTSSGIKYTVLTKGYIDEIKPVKDEFINQIRGFSPKIPKFKRKKIKDPCLCEISLPDIHYGKLGDKSTAELEEDWFNSILELVNKSSGFNVERFLLPIGNDGMNVDNMRKTTTSGTPQSESMPYYESFSGYCRLMIKGIDFLSAIAPVDVVVISGNHDYERMYYAGEVLDAWYNNNPNVDINNIAEDRKFYKYGKTMLMFTHGEKEKPEKMAMNIPLDNPKMFSETEHWEVHCGHFHKEMVLDEFKKIKVRFLPSICANDEWHKKNGYRNYRCAQAYLWDKETGFTSMMQVNTK